MPRPVALLDANVLYPARLGDLLVPAWRANTSKRVVKTPKVFVRDTGLLHALFELGDLDQVLGHPAAGPSYATFAVENLIAAAGPGFQAHHYRSATGNEVDLVLVRGGRPVVAVEVKRSTSPTLSSGTRRAVRDLRVDAAYLVHPDSGAAYDSGGVTAERPMTAAATR